MTEQKYKPYNVDSLLSAVEAKLAEVQGEYKQARAVHNETYLPDYEAYPFRSPSGNPEYNFLTDEERNDLLQIFWPPVVQSWMPSLRARPIASGADIRTIRDGSSWPDVTQCLKLLAWNCLPKDNGVYRQAQIDRRDAFEKAHKAWLELEYCQPRPPYFIQYLQETVDSLNRFKADKHAELKAAMIFMNDEEAGFLSKKLEEKDCDDLYKALSPLRYPYLNEGFSFLTDKFNSASMLEEKPDAPLLDKIKQTLSLCPEAKSLLDLAEKEGIRVHLMHRDSENGCAAQISGLDIYLINATEDNIGDQCVSLAHELRHFWQMHMFGHLYQDTYKNSVDRLVLTLVMEADAYAFEGMCAYVLNRCGVLTSFWNSDYGLNLIEEYEAYVAEQGCNEDDAQKDLASIVFGIFSEPNYLKPYEEKWVCLYQPSAEIIETLPELIASSPYSQPAFLKQIAVIDGHSYLNRQSYLTDDDIAYVQNNLSSRERPVYGIVSEQNARLVTFSL